MGRYFFSKDKWVKDMGDSCDGFTGPDNADNCEVVFGDGETEWGLCCDNDGHRYNVHRDWCETVDGIDLTGEGRQQCEKLKDAIEVIEQRDKKGNGMAKIVGIKLGNHASYQDAANRVYYYFALDDYNLGDTVAVILPGGKMVCVPVVEKADTTDGKVDDIEVKKYVVGKVDDAKYREHKKVEKAIKEKKVALRRKGHAIKNRIEYLVGQKTWIDWAREDIGILTLLGDYYLAKKDYEAVAGKGVADIEDARISDERIDIGDDGLPY